MAASPDPPTGSPSGVSSEAAALGSAAAPSQDAEATATSRPVDRRPPDPARRTRVSAAFNGLMAAAVVLLLLLIFILENTASVKINFLGLHGHVALGAALLIAAVAGSLLTGLVAFARILQLRTRAKQLRRTGR